MICFWFVMTWKAQKEVYYKLLEAYKSKQLPLKELEESAARINSLKLKRAKRFEGENPAPNQPVPAWRQESAVNLSRFSKMREN